MQEFYETKIKVITLVVVLRSVGSVVGAFSSGLLLDKFPKLRYFILFGCTCLMGLTTAILPHMIYLWAFFVVSIVSSFACGALDTGGNVLCLDTWKDSSGPYLHSIHFSFAVMYLHTYNASIYISMTSHVEYTCTDALNKKQLFWGP